MKITQAQANKLYNKKFVTPPDAGRLLGLSRQYIWALIKDNTLESIEINGIVYVGVPSLKKYAYERKQKILRTAESIFLPTL